MAAYIKDGHLTYVDENGDVYILMPVTKLENIEGNDTLVKKTAAGLAELLAAGPIVLTEGKDYGREFPENAVKGQLFLKKV